MLLSCDENDNLVLQSHAQKLYAETMFSVGSSRRQKNGGATYSQRGLPSEATHTRLLDLVDAFAHVQSLREGQRHTAVSSSCSSAMKS